MKRLLAKTVSTLLTVGFVVGLLPAAAAANWAEPYLHNLVQREVMQGDRTGELYPNNMITRAEFAAMLNRAFGFNQRDKKGFSDVEETDWYAADIASAAYQGYMQGNGKGANPNGNLTREEAAAMLCRALKITPREGEEFILNDQRDFANWSRGYINSAVNKRFVNGYPDGTFRPTNNITRGEAAKMLSEVAGEIVTANKGQASGTVNGNVTIASSGTTLSDATILGDLYLTEGVGLGYVNLNNVSVGGEFILSGAGESNIGESSVTLSDSSISNLIVDVSKQKILTLKTDRSTTVENTTIKSSAYLEELTDNYGGFNKIIIDGPVGTYLNLSGSFGDVRMISPESKLSLFKGSLDGIAVDEKAKNAKIFLEKDTKTNAIYFDTGATVTGTGKIDSVLINNDGVVIDQLPENIYIRPGVTAKINGKVMGSMDAETDALSPEFSKGYPKVDKIQPTGFTEYYKTNKPGKIYYAVYAIGMPAPSKDDLIAKNTPPKNAIKSGNVLALPDKEVSTAISGLKAGTRYVVHSLFVDLRDKSSDIKVNYVETVDNVMPTLLSGYPKLTSTDRDGAVITLVPNKDTSYYWAVMEDKAIAPTTEQLYTQNISGSKAMGVTKGGIMNTPVDITIKGNLKEFAPYAFYVILRDNAENMSKTPYKLPFTTKDVTAPKFKPADPPYPKVGAVTVSTIPLEYAVDEACTVYWSAVKTGTALLPTLSDGTADFKSQKAKDIIKNGSAALKSGTSTASKADTLVKFSISGLEAQMPYDLYFLLEDKELNQSEIVKITAKTKDSVPPTATVSSEQVTNGNFAVDSPVTLAFSEIVCGATGNEAGDPDLFRDLFAKDKKSLESYVKLWNTSEVPAQEVVIDWNKVKVEDVDAKTIMTFQLGAIPLLNNNKYRFDLSYKTGYVIRDTTKNPMKLPTQLNFSTAPPLTYFSELTSFDAAQYHSAFMIRPEAQNTGKHIYFDMLIQSDQPIMFELYAGKSMTSLAPVVNPKGEKIDFLINANYATSFSQLVNQHTTYKDLKETYYAIKLKQVGSTVVGSPVPITVNVNLTISAVIGDENALNGLPGPSATFAQNLKDKIAAGKVSLVTAPTDPFKLLINLVDQLPPALAVDPSDNNKVIPPEFFPGDRQVLMQVKTTKGCTLHYYAIPKDVKHDVPTVYQIQTATSDPGRGIAAGKFDISDNSTVPTEHLITGLLPPPKNEQTRPYNIYFYLQGQAADPSQVYKDYTFYTIPVSQPKLNGTLNYTAGSGKVIVTGLWTDDAGTNWESDCKMHYVVYPTDVYQGVNLPDVPDVLTPLYPTRLTAGGDIPVTSTKDFKLEIPKLKYTIKYDIFVVAQKYVGSEPSGAPSKVFFLENMSPMDDIAPQILANSPNSVCGYDETSKTFHGSVDISFTEGLYYFKNADNSQDVLPLKKSSLEDGSLGLLKFLTAGGNISFADSTYPESDEAISYMRFNFWGLTGGETITITKPLGDKAANVAGDLQLRFVVSTSQDTTGKVTNTGTWTASFTPPLRPNP